MTGCWPKIRREGYKPLPVRPFESILNDIPAFAAPSTVSSDATGLRFQCHKIMEGIWVPESPLERRPPRRAARLALDSVARGSQPMCEITEIVVTATGIHCSNTEIGIKRRVLA